jgi:transcriptional regulator with XRE-family HTH domain
MIRVLHSVRSAPQKHTLAPRLTAERLKEIRQALGLSQVAMAKELDYSENRYCLIETDQVAMPVALRIRLREVALARIDSEIARLQSLAEQVRHEPF